MPTITALAGIRTVASGNESEPIYAIKTCSMTGGSSVTLANAEPDKVVWTLNAPDEADFHFPKNAYVASDIPVVNGHDVQFYRNGDLLFFGPITQVKGSGKDGAVTAHAIGADWYLNRRFVDGPTTNLLTNPDFESGLTGWTANGGITATASTDTFVTGSHSAKLVCTTAGGDTQIHQNSSAGPNGVGVLMTLSGWFYIDSITAPAFSWIGLYLEGGPSGGARQQNNWWPIDQFTPQKKWTKASCTIQIPPNQTWDLQVRLYAPQGTIYWDDIKLVAMDSLSTAGLTGNALSTVDVSEIVRMVVGHEQSTFWGKSDLNIGVTAETTGVKLAKTYQFVDHVQFDTAMKEFVERGDGIDYSMDITPTTRTFHSYAFKRGTDRSGSVVLTYDVSSPSTTNCSDYRFSQDAAQCITRQTVIGSDNGVDRESGEAVNATPTNGVILQDVLQAPQGATADSLQPLANERIARFASVPVSLEMDVLGSSGYIPTIKCGDIVTVAVVDGFVSIFANYRVMKMSLDCKLNVLTVTCTVDSLA